MLQLLVGILIIVVILILVVAARLLFENGEYVQRPEIDNTTKPPKIL